MFFTNGDHQAFESLMRDKPGDHYDSGEDGPFPECRSCCCHRLHRKDRYCKYAECPYTPDRVTAIDQGNLPGKGGEAAPASRQSSKINARKNHAYCKTKWTKRLAAMLCTMLLMCAALPVCAFADDVHIFTAYQPYMYFKKYDGVWGDLGTPTHSVVETGQPAYCLQMSLESPYGDGYDATDGLQ